MCSHKFCSTKGTTKLLLDCDSQLLHRCCKLFVLRLLKAQINRSDTARNSTENIEAPFVVLLRSPRPSGEQVGSGLPELHERPAVTEFKPAAFDGKREARRILHRRARAASSTGARLSQGFSVMNFIAAAMPGEPPLPRLNGHRCGGCRTCPRALLRK